MQFWIAPSVRSCFRDARPQRDDSEKYTLEGAKGEFVSLQLCLRNQTDVKSDADISNHAIGVKGVKITKNSENNYDIDSVRLGCQEYMQFGDGEYPEPITNGFVPFEVVPNTTQSIWLTFPIDDNSEAGEYVFDVTLDSDCKDELKGQITLKVYDVQIPPSHLGEFSVEHFTSPDHMELMDFDGYNFKIYDDKWWDFMENYARSLRECRNNIYRVYPLYLLGASGSRRISETEWHFDFTMFDRLVNFLIETKTAKKFAIEDFIVTTDKADAMALDENGDVLRIACSDPLAEVWLKAYLSALYDHILETSNPDIWIMHIEDEPNDLSVWRWGRELVRACMPKIKCGNPTCTDISYELGKDTDIHIPQFNFVDKKSEYYDEIAKENKKEIWPYCCCVPYESWYLNRFIDRKAIEGRLISWATFSKGFDGFLHYGYNWWADRETFYPFSIRKYSTYKGDCMLIYPSPEDNSYKIGVRYINMRDGAQDFELLKLVEKALEKRARDLSKTVASTYDVFDTDEKKFLKARHDLLVLAQRVTKK